VVFLQAGRVTEHTPAEEFFEEPRSAEARAFLKGDLFW
jgi:tungstate transport system ATP-binding protein